MREIDVAHQAEDQGEAARNQEVEAAKRDAVEDRVEEDLLAADRVFQSRRPDREDQPKQHRNRDDDDQRPGRMAFDKAGHGSRSTGEELRRRSSRCRSDSPEQAAYHAMDGGPCFQEPLSGLMQAST